MKEIIIALIPTIPVVINLFLSRKSYRQQKMFASALSFAGGFALGVVAK